QFSVPPVRCFRLVVPVSDGLLDALRLDPELEARYGELATTLRGRADVETDLARSCVRSAGSVLKAPELRAPCGSRRITLGRVRPSPCQRASPLPHAADRTAMRMPQAR